MCIKYAEDIFVQEKIYKGKQEQLLNGLVTAFFGGI